MIWKRYSKKLKERIDRPKAGGFFTEEDAARKGMRLSVGREGEEVALYLLVDLSDGVIADVKFQAYGHTALIGAADAACELLLRKNYDQALRISADLIDRHVRDQGDLPAFPKEVGKYLNHVIDAIEKACEQCRDIPLADTYAAPPMSLEEEAAVEYPGWPGLSTKQKITVIEEVIASDIRPYIQLDAGDVKVLNLLDEKEVVIAYSGACTSCYSSTGATLNAIQQILRMKVHPHLIVTPNLTYHEVSSPEEMGSTRPEGS